jgi:hypothetical protein
MACSVLGVGEEEVVGAVLPAEDAAAVVESVLLADELEADGALLEAGLAFGLLTNGTGVGYRHGPLRLILRGRRRPRIIALSPNVEPGMGSC